MLVIFSLVIIIHFISHPFLKNISLHIRSLTKAAIWGACKCFQLWQISCDISFCKHVVYKRTNCSEHTSLHRYGLRCWMQSVSVFCFMTEQNIICVIFNIWVVAVWKQSRSVCDIFELFYNYSKIWYFYNISSY